jgi:hypothetical protein
MSSDLYCKGNTFKLDKPILNLAPFSWNGAVSSFICADARYDKREEMEEEEEQ